VPGRIMHRNIMHRNIMHRSIDYPCGHSVEVAIGGSIAVVATR
jgi:hypothetical protein